jgi:hypothetical protein
MVRLDVAEIVPKSACEFALLLRELRGFAPFKRFFHEPHHRSEKGKVIAGLYMKIYVFWGIAKDKVLVGLDVHR